MGPLPKRKVSKSRRDRRRAHDALTLKHLVECGNCGEYHIAHRVCPYCGFYKDKVVIEIEND